MVGVCCMEVDVGGGSFHSRIRAGEVGRNVLCVVGVFSFVCYRMFTVRGV